MITVNDHQTLRLFDPWDYLGPKRRKLLDTSWSGVFREYLLEKLPVEKVAKHFDEVMGRPSKELYTAIGTLILQQLCDLSDPEVIRAVAFNIDWHYALDITDESDAGKYISERTLRTYRRILIKEGLDRVLFETLTDTLIKAFDVDTTKQRLDSTLIQSNMRKLGRIRIFANTIRKFLKKLRRTHRDLFDTLLESWFSDRYLAKESEGCFSQVKPSEASRTLEGLSEDLLYLVELFSSHDRVSRLSEYRLLKRVLGEQCRVSCSGTDTKVEIKPPKEVPTNSLQNPSDPDAGYDSHKGQGFKVQIMETYQTEKQDDKKPDLITHVEVKPAHEHDAKAIQPAIDSTQERKCCPEELTCDTLYGSDENVQEAATKGVAVIAPVKGPKNSPDIGLKGFRFDEETNFVVSCPEGHKPLKVNRTRKKRISARFNKNICKACPRYKNCSVYLKKKAAFLYYDDKVARLAMRRSFEETKEFKDKYRWRAGIEATMSHYKIDVGGDRLTVRYLNNVRFAVMLKTLGLNILRCSKALVACLRPYFIRFSSLISPQINRINKLYAILHILLSKNSLIYEIAR